MENKILKKLVSIIIAIPLALIIVTLGNYVEVIGKAIPYLPAVAIIVLGFERMIEGEKDNK